jgi:hypothetical protein
MHSSLFSPPLSLSLKRSPKLVHYFSEWHDCLTKVFIGWERAHRYYKSSIYKITEAQNIITDNGLNN